MANILYIGQAISYEDPIMGIIPAIFLGKNSEDKPVIVTQKINTATKTFENDFQKWNLNNGFEDCDFVRQTNESSPTKYSIYYGKFCKKILGSFLIKVPELEVLLAELKEIKNYI